MARPTCPRCLLPLSTCLCALVRPVANATELLILQHPLEQGQAKNTARLLHLCLARSRLLVGERFEPAALAPLLEDTVLLYPGESAAPMPARPRRLVVLDGTWRKSRKLLALNPQLQALPRLGWQAPPPSRYRVRKAQQAHQLSTLEAAALALEELDGRSEPYEPLWLAFEGLMSALSRRANRGVGDPAVVGE
ncbi:MAG TPA: tRNA-uridine aminocarboxypropyltransferase [Roseateles sp.]|nr:tRNA-uridine aminocarboxypropyltransferase [Roseateles sp.]